MNSPDSRGAHCDPLHNSRIPRNLTDCYARLDVQQALLGCLRSREALFAVVGLGYVVLPLSLTFNALAPHLRPGQMIRLESTPYPGTTEAELRPAIESQGLKVGEDVFLIYSPERENSGNQGFTTAAIPKVKGGSTPACREVGQALYAQVICEVVTVSSTQAAEMTKLLAHIHRTVNIGLMNELKPLADRMAINLYELIKAAATTPFGFVPYFQGPAWAITAQPSTPSVSPGKRESSACSPASSNWRVRSMRAGLPTWPRKPWKP